MENTERRQKVGLALLAMQRHSWEQGVAMQAFYEMGDMPTVAALATEAVYRQTPDGRCAMIGVTDGVTDPCSVGEALLATVRATGDATLAQGAQKLLDWTLEGAPRSAEGVLYHLTDSCQFWVDSLYMLPPYLAAAGQYEAALANLYGYWDRLYDEKARLMHHQWDEGAQRFVRALHWGVGNGWALAALARMAGLLPQAYAEDRTRIIGMARELIDGVLAHRRADGLFHDVVDDPESFVETNLSQMLAYTLYRGMADGWLDRDMAAEAEALRAAALAKVDERGFVQGVCGAPTFDKPGLAPEGQAFHLLMEAARDKWSDKQGEQKG